MTDMRKSDCENKQEKQYEMRKLIVDLRLKGQKNSEIAKNICISESYASTIWRKYMENGYQAIEPIVQGRQYGEKRIIPIEQERALLKLLFDKTPDRLGYQLHAVPLWSREVARLVIKNRYGLDLPIRTIGEYFKRWGLAPQKPTKSVNKQYSQKLAQWLKDECRGIADLAKEEEKGQKVEIQWCTLTSFNSKTFSDKSFAPKGQTLPIQGATTQDSIKMISAITNRGTVRFLLYKKTVFPKVLINFLSRLVKGSERKVILIVGYSRVYHTKSVKRWLEWQKDKIEVVFLPRWWAEVKTDKSGGAAKNKSKG